ncbi:MAG: S41 family peptidase [Planctomycetota bacterium]
MSSLSRSARASVMALLLLGTSSLLDAGSVVKRYDDRVNKIVERHIGTSLEEVWRGAIELERLGEESIGDIQLLLGHENSMVRLMASKALLSIGEASGVRDTLISICENGDAPSVHRASAVTLLSEFRDPRTERTLRTLASTEAKGDSLLRVEVGKSLYSVTRDRKLARELLHPLLGVDDEIARTGAAIALAELGLFDGDVKRVLRSIELEPSRQGIVARLLLERDRLLRSLEREEDAKPPPTSERLLEAEKEILALETALKEKEQDLKKSQRRRRQAGTKNPLLDEILQRIRHFYVEPNLVDDDQLIIEAAKGMVRSLDPFSSFMDVKDTKDFYEGISGEYAGIGAQVQKDPETDTLKILRPIYKGPAYRAGIISEDLVIEVEGVPTKGRSLDEIVKGLKGKPSTPVTLNVFRRGWREPKEFVITRETIQLDSVLYQMLPGNLGYINLIQFGDTAVREVVSALDDLESQEMRGLILDLRNNPGGYLQSAVQLVDEFVDETSMPIVSQKSESGVFDDSERFATKGMRPDYPVVILVNGSSASASEIVSGALQDFKRARLIGKKTFGKGSVQRLLPMTENIKKLLGGESTLRLTVQHYYLPSGRSIHTRRDRDGKITAKGGIEPDLEVEPLELPLWRIEAIGRLSDKNAFEEWIDSNFSDNKEAVSSLVENGDTGITYPGFDEWFEKHAGPGLTEEDARFGLRNRLRRMVEDERGAQFACDYSEDLQLQAAILDLLGSLGTEVSTIPQYNNIIKAKPEEKPEDGDGATEPEFIISAMYHSLH